MYETVYPERAQFTPVGKKEQARPERRGVSTKRPIDAAKDAVSVLELAERLCPDLQRAGAECKACCPLPDHEDGTPSFTVNPEKNVWFCHGCIRGGDVVELAMFAWSFDKSTVAMAAAALLHEFGHEIPNPPPSWFAKGQRQQGVREQIDRIKIGHVRELVFALVFKPWLRTLPGHLLENATADAWEGSLPIAQRIYEGRRNNG